jgi:hypothetical protein
MPPMTDLESAREANATRAAIAAAEGRPAPAPLPLPHPGGLIAWTYCPTDPCPLPPPSARRSRLGAYGMVDLFGWPVGLLPMEAIAADLLGEGITFARGIGYTHGRERLDAEGVARRVTDLLDATAESLPDPRLAEFRAWEADLRRVATAARDEALFDVENGLDVPLLEWAMFLDTSGPSRASLKVARERATAADHAEDTPEVVRERAAIRQGLRATANEIRTSAAARRSLIASLRPHLTAAPAAPHEDTLVASEFLARYDGEAAVRRSSLVREYGEAGAPGNLSPSDLRALATDRWGQPVRRRGHFTYRPGANA